MSKTSIPSKLILSSVTLLVLLGIVALSTGAQSSATQKSNTDVKAPAAKPATIVKAVTKAAATPVAQVPSTEKPEATPAEVATYLEDYGWMVGQQAGFEMGFSAAEKAAIMKGLGRAAAGEKAPENMKESFPKMQEYLSTKEKAYRATQMAKQAEEAKVHIAEGEKFLADVAKKPGIKKTASGLYYEIETPGTGKQPTAEDVATIHYTGKLIDGTVFDSSIERGTPVDLPLYGVIPGFSEGLQLLKEGGKATLYIPANLAYGNQAAGPIPSGSTLVFHVELIKVQSKPATPDAPSAAASKEPVSDDEKSDAATPAAETIVKAVTK